MSKKKDPIVGVMEFFEGAELSAAQSALALAQAILKKRQPSAEKKKGTRARVVRTKPINQATPIAPPAIPVPPPISVPTEAVTAPAPRRSRARTNVVVPAAPAAVGGHPDLALPGLGPSTIGD